MAEELVKASLVMALDEQSKEDIEKEISESIAKGVEKASEKKFNFKNIGKDMLKGVSDATGTTAKVQERSIKAAKAYAGQQSKIASLVTSQGKTLTKAKAIVGATGKLGIMGAKGMGAAINPYVAAVMVAAEAVKVMADQFQRIAKESAKFVGQGSIFADKQTMGMMQMTGQTGTQAQGTQRSLDMLGMNFSDIQQGKMTQEQAMLFEALRSRELAKLEEINAVAGPMFKSMQQATLGVSLLMQDINDWITMAFARSAGVEKMIGSIKSFITTAGPFMQGLIDSVMPIVGIIASVIGVVLDVISAVMDAIDPIWEVLIPILEVIDQIVAVVAQVVGPILIFIGGIIKVVLKGIVALIWPLIEAFKVLGKALGWLQDKILKPIADFFNDIITYLGDLINKAIDALKSVNIAGWKPFENMEYLDIGTTTSAITNSGVTYDNQTTNNYIYGSQTMNQANPRTNANDLFTNTYTLVND